MNKSFGKSKLPYFILLLGILGVIILIAIFLTNQQGYEHINKTEYFRSYRADKSKNYNKTSINNVSVFWADSRPSDGDFTCVIYSTSTKQIIAKKTTTSGFNSEHKVSSRTTVYSNQLNDSQIANLIQAYCGK